jgi:hypothetical protein
MHDPLYRLETVLVKYLTQNGELATARQSGRRLPGGGDGWELWHRYSSWARAASKGRPTEDTKLREVMTPDRPEELVRFFLYYFELA